MAVTRNSVLVQYHLPSEARPTAGYGVVCTLLWFYVIWYVLEPYYGRLSEWTGLAAGIRQGSNLLLALGHLCHLGWNLLLIVVAVMLARAPVRSYLGWLTPRGRDVTIGVGVIVLVHLLVIGGMLLVIPLKRAPELSALIDLVFGSPLTFLGLAAFGLVYAPIFEETLLRGFLWRGLESGLGPWPTLILVSVIFAAMHPTVTIAVSNLVMGKFPTSGGDIFFTFSALRITVDGLVFGWLRWRTGGTVAGMTAHCTANALTLAASPTIYGSLAL